MGGWVQKGRRKGGTWRERRREGERAKEGRGESGGGKLLFYFIVLMFSVCLMLVQFVV